MCTIHNVLLVSFVTALVPLKWSNISDATRLWTNQRKACKDYTRFNAKHLKEVWVFFCQIYHGTKHDFQVTKPLLEYEDCLFQDAMFQAAMFGFVNPLEDVSFANPKNNCETFTTRPTQKKNRGT